MIQYESISCAGNKQYNEDCVGMAEKNGVFCFALADGVGNHPAGHSSSKLVVQTVMQLFEKTGAFSGFLAEAFESAQKQVMQRKKELRVKSGMHTTLTVAYIDEKTISFGYVGNSRCYVWEGGRLIAQSVDQAIPQMLVEKGRLKTSEIRNHPQRNQLLCAIGEEWSDLSYELHENIARKKGQTLLLCTDGFWNLITEEQMESCMERASTPKQWLKYMEDIVIANGMRSRLDNYSAVAVWDGEKEEKTFFQALFG